MIQYATHAPRYAGYCTVNMNGTISIVHIVLRPIQSSFLPPSPVIVLLATRTPRRPIAKLNRVLEAKDMTVKLRQIHDSLEGEVKQKKKRLVEMKRSVEERNSQVSAELWANEGRGIRYSTFDRQKSQTFS